MNASAKPTLSLKLQKEIAQKIGDLLNKELFETHSVTPEDFCLFWAQTSANILASAMKTAQTQDGKRPTVDSDPVFFADMVENYLSGFITILKMRLGI